MKGLSSWDRFRPQGHERHEMGAGISWQASLVVRSILDFNMQLVKVREIACRLKLEDHGMGKTDLIRRIQRAENNLDCYGSERVKYCQEKDCLWRVDCEGLVRSKLIPNFDALRLDRKKPASRGISMISDNFLSKTKQDRRWTET